MYVAAKEFHSSPLPKLPLVTDVTISQFSFGPSGDNIVNIICSLSLICSITFRALLSLSSKYSLAVSSESASL